MLVPWLQIYKMQTALDADKLLCLIRSQGVSHPTNKWTWAKVAFSPSICTSSQSPSSDVPGDSVIVVPKIDKPHKVL